MWKVKDKERLLKTAREKQLVKHKGDTMRLLASWFLNRNFADQKGLAENIQSDESKEYSQDYSTQ